jgi:sec-independent protein translocase protein TatA
MFNIGPQELFWLFLIVLLIFGAKRIPEIGRSIGRGIQEFKKGIREVETELQINDKAPTAPMPPVSPMSAVSPQATPPAQVARPITPEDRQP